MTHPLRAKKAILTAFKVQQTRLGFGMVELLNTCCTNWRLDPVEALDWVRAEMIPVYPLGDFKLADGVRDL